MFWTHHIAECRVVHDSCENTNTKEQFANCPCVFHIWQLFAQPQIIVIWQLFAETNYHYLTTLQRQIVMSQFGHQQLITRREVAAQRHRQRHRLDLVGICIRFCFCLYFVCLCILPIVSKFCVIYQ